MNTRVRFIVLAAFSLAPFSVPGLSQGKAPTSTKVDTNTIVVDLDQPAKYVYKTEILANVPIGSKPGEIGLRDPMEGMTMDNIVVDADSNIYIDDSINRRIEMFDKRGRFQKVVFVYPPSIQTGMVSIGECVSCMAINSQRHLFLPLVNSKSGTDAGTWEIFEGKILKKYPTRGRPIVLGDDKLWFETSGSVVSIDGKRLAPTQWPWRNRSRIISHRLSPNEWEVIIPNPSARLLFRSQKGISLEGGSVPAGGAPILATSENIFFYVNQTFMCRIHLPDLSMSLVGFGKVSGPDRQDILANDGNIYGFESNETSPDIGFRFIKSASIERNE